MHKVGKLAKKATNMMSLHCCLISSCWRKRQLFLSASVHAIWARSVRSEEPALTYRLTQIPAKKVVPAISIVMIEPHKELQQNLFEMRDVASGE